MYSAQAGMLIATCHYKSAVVMLGERVRQSGQGQSETLVATDRSVGWLGALGRRSSSASPLVGESLDARREASLGRSDVLRDGEMGKRQRLP